MNYRCWRIRVIGISFTMRHHDRKYPDWVDLANILYELRHLEIHPTHLYYIPSTPPYHMHLMTFFCRKHCGVIGSPGSSESLAAAERPKFHEPHSSTRQRLQSLTSNRNIPTLFLPLVICTKSPPKILRYETSHLLRDNASEI